jgi:hypothetical protein
MSTVQVLAVVAVHTYGSFSYSSSKFAAAAAAAEAIAHISEAACARQPRTS